MDASRSRNVQVATPVVGEEAVSYNISTINLEIALREHKIDHFQEFVAMVVHLMQKDKLSKEEHKAHMANFTTYIQQWSSIKELSMTSLAPP